MSLQPMEEWREAMATGDEQGFADGKHARGRESDRENIVVEGESSCHTCN